MEQKLLNTSYQSSDASAIIFLHKKSGIRETKHLSTNADTSTDTKKILLVKQNLAKKIEIKIVWRFYTIYEQKFSNLRPCLSITFPQGFSKSKKFLNLTSGSGGKKTFIQSEQMKNISFFCPGNFTPFMSKSFQI